MAIGKSWGGSKMDTRAHGNMTLKHSSQLSNWQILTRDTHLVADMYIGSHCLESLKQSNLFYDGNMVSCHGFRVFFCLSQWQNVVDERQTTMAPVMMPQEIVLRGYSIRYRGYLMLK